MSSRLGPRVLIHCGMKNIAVQWDSLISSLIIVGAVATDVPLCSEMAAGILKRNGSAVDAAITALLCVGVVHAESSGIGGYVCFSITSN